MGWGRCGEIGFEGLGVVFGFSLRPPHPAAFGGRPLPLLGERGMSRPSSLAFGFLGENL